MRAILIAIALVVAVTGCNTRTHQLVTTLNRTEQQPPRIVLMPLDVELSLLSAAGMPEPRADWTQQAKGLLHDAIRAEQQSRDIRMVVYDDSVTAGGTEQDLMHQLLKLHGVVGNSILIHQYNPQLALPSKNGAFEWSLGPGAKALKQKYNADYALFVWVRDSYSSGGRVALILVGAALGIGIPGGQQLGFASLVELETGNVVWFNLLARGHGDLRHAEGAQNTAVNLLSQLPQ